MVRIKKYIVADDVSINYRTIVLKLSSLAVVLVSLYFDVNKCRKGSDDRGHSSDDERDCDPVSLVNCNSAH